MVSKLFLTIDFSEHDRVAFSEIITWKYWKNITKPLINTNPCPKSYCPQKGIIPIENLNIKQQHLGKKKLNLKERFKNVLPETWANI